MQHEEFFNIILALLAYIRSFHAPFYSPPKNRKRAEKESVEVMRENWVGHENHMT